MSFHDTPELLEEILAAYGDGLDFLQLQINYVDWDQPNVQSRRCLEVANRYHKPVIVMEPCKGRHVDRPARGGERLLKEYAPEASPASWAMRFAASQKGVIRVLSGMNTLEQVRDNAATFRDFRAAVRGGAGCHPPGDTDHRAQHAHPLHRLRLLHPRLSQAHRHSPIFCPV